MDPILGLPIALPPRGSGELRHSLHRQLRTAILDGRLKSGVRLPPTRDFARAFGVSRNTAVAVYDLLMSEGYIVARRGSGSYISLRTGPARKRASIRDNRTGDRRLNAYWRTLSADALTEVATRWDFQLGQPDLQRFPFDIWRRASARALRSWARKPSAARDTQGEGVLREAIAQHVSFARAVACSADDIVVTAGAQQALDLLARVLVTPEQTLVAFENPGYPPARAVFAAAGARIHPVAVDEEGLDIERLPARAQVIYATPSHQFPLGCPLSMPRRLALLEFAHRQGAVIIEDDYDGEFRFDGRPLDALQTLDRAESVFYVGTFSKSLFPAIRLGFIVAPSWAKQALVAAKRSADVQCPPATQHALASFIVEGHMARHVRKMQRVYAGRRRVLVDTLRRDFSRWLEPLPSTAGLHLAAMLKSAESAASLAQRARASDVGVYPVDRFAMRGKVRPSILFGYGAIEERAIAAALVRLRGLWR